MKSKPISMAVIAGFMSAAIYGDNEGAPTYKLHEKQPRPCLNCGKPHTHNNSWCSAGCCREYRSTVLRVAEELGYERGIRDTQQRG